MPNLFEMFMVLVVGALLLAASLVGPILALIAYIRSRNIASLMGRIANLETELARLRAEGRQTAVATPRTESHPASTVAPTSTVAPAADDEIADAVVISETRDVPASGPAPSVWAPPPPPPAAWSSSPAPSANSRPPHSGATAPRAASAETMSLEMLIGRQALGWIAVVALLFATGFFLRYAYENEWIGPIGRVSIGIVASVALLIAGWRRDRQGWRLYSRMLTSAGVVVLYASTFSAFGFYNLIPRGALSVLLTVVVAETMLLAIAYRSLGIALMAVLGGFITPLLLHSDHDQYVSLFAFLLVLTAGNLAAASYRRWPLVGITSLLGAQSVFWLWFLGNYHPDKLTAALVFQALLFALHRLQGWHAASCKTGDSLWDEMRLWEELARSFLSAGLGFLAVLALLSERHLDWRATAAMCFAAAYAIESRLLIASPRASRTLLLFAVGISTGFVALALPLQASTAWVSLGWSALAAVLWWFGWRVERWQLRLLAGTFGVLALVRLAFYDIPRLSWDQAARGEFKPLFNAEAAPALAAIALLLTVLVIIHRRIIPRSELERFAAGAGVVTCLLMLCYLVSVDLYEWFRPTRHSHPGLSAEDLLTLGVELKWRRRASMWLSIWWGVYATCLLAIGFAIRASLSRWTALGLLAITLTKVFLVDMAALDQIYRIAAFFVLALTLGVAAWAYQRFGATRGSDQ